MTRRDFIKTAMALLGVVAGAGAQTAATPAPAPISATTARSMALDSAGVVAPATGLMGIRVCKSADVDMSYFGNDG